MAILNEDLLVLKENFTLYQTASKSGFVKNYSILVYRQLLNLYTKYVSAQHSYSHWCGDCRFDLVLRLYGWALQQPEFEAMINQPVEPEVIIPNLIAVETPDIVVNNDNAITELKKKRGRPKRN